MGKQLIRMINDQSQNKIFVKNTVIEKVIFPPEKKNNFPHFYITHDLQKVANIANRDIDLLGHKLKSGHIVLI